ncbi:uncharacterized protein LOC100502370 [Zea mays]|uniref:Uncharacterized protein n=1 Tax=Zea mays TaxID=4577 RepID=C4JAT3_MAIZE|nr:uncharacterized protein LOC100502370 [Zea mays]ACR38283.1 unknown [Zea mays]|eukprot:NP_001183777.1 uncharacterized protein LOC100502370 [Zea mays]
MATAPWSLPDFPDHALFLSLRADRFFRVPWSFFSLADSIFPSRAARRCSSPTPRPALCSLRPSGALSLARSSSPWSFLVALARIQRPASLSYGGRVPLLCARVPSPCSAHPWPHAPPARGALPYFRSGRALAPARTALELPCSQFSLRAAFSSSQPNSSTVQRPVERSSFHQPEAFSSPGAPARPLISPAAQLLARPCVRHGDSLCWRLTARPCPNAGHRLLPSSRVVRLPFVNPTWALSVS